MLSKEEICVKLKDTVLGHMFGDELSIVPGVIEGTSVLKIDTVVASISYMEMGTILTALGARDLWLEVWECGTSEDLVTGLRVCLSMDGTP